MEHKNTKEFPVIITKDNIILPGAVTKLRMNSNHARKACEVTEKNGGFFFLVALKEIVQRGEFDKCQLFSVGTVCHIEQTGREPDGVDSVIVQAYNRSRVLSYSSDDDLITAVVTPYGETLHKKPTDEQIARMHAVLREFEKNLNLDPTRNKEMMDILLPVKDPETVCNIITSQGRFSRDEKQKVLEIPLIADQLEYLLMLLMHDNEMLVLEKETAKKIRNQMEKEQRDYFFRENIKMINEQLNGGSTENEHDELLRAAENAHMPKDVFEKVKKELSRFSKLQPFSPEAGVARTYIETLTELPWDKHTDDELDLISAERVLDEDHYGLDDVKKRILEYLAVRKRAGSKMRSQVICFVGPPGVGKTSLGRSIARAMKRKFVNISLGGMHDEAEIRGHRRTYIGALPGRIIQKIKECGVNNPLILMDEIDKLGSDFRGDPSSALLEVLDTEQNYRFTDNFLEVPFDLSKVMFITTANNASAIPRPLLDRMELITLPGYVMEEKVEIAKRHLIPRIVEENGIAKKDLKINDDGLRYIISSYTMEAGVRSLDRELTKAARKIAAEIEKNGEPKRSVSLTKKRIHELLDAPKIHGTQLPKEPSVGKAIGLAWTENGGDVLIIESVLMPGTGKILTTGNLGNIMKESTEAALAYIKSHSEELGLSDFEWDKKDVHIHVPAGAVPKDGPSAGITLALSLSSSLTGRKIDVAYAMTGEITLHGDVLPIGGLREKILAAKRHGITDIILPEANRNDTEWFNDWILGGMTLHFVENVSEVFALALKADKK